MRLVHCLERRWLADSPPQPTQHRDINIRGVGYVASEMGSLFVLQLHRMTSREKRYAR